MKKYESTLLGINVGKSCYICNIPYTLDRYYRSSDTELLKSYKEKNKVGITLDIGESLLLSDVFAYEDTVDCAICFGTSYYNGLETDMFMFYIVESCSIAIKVYNDILFKGVLNLNLFNMIYDKDVEIYNIKNFKNNNIKFECINCMSVIYNKSKNYFNIKIGIQRK